jgi:hypothetical protein
MRKRNNIKIKILLLIVLALILLATIFLPKNKEKDINNEEVQVVQKEDERLIIPESYQVKTLNKKDDYLTFDVKYPVFKYVDDQFNQKIVNLLEIEIENQKKYAEENWLIRYETQLPGDGISKITKDNDKWPFYSDFTIVQSNESFISFVLTYGGFTGGAHGYENKISFNYDLKNNKEIKLKDIFSDKFDYLKYLSDESRKELKKQFAVLSEEDKANSSPEAVQEYIDNMISMIEEGTLQEEDNFDIFTFTQNKIKIYFAQYQVGPYVIGMPEVEFDRK